LYSGSLNIWKCLLSFSKDIFTGYRIQGWQFLIFLCFKDAVLLPSFLHYFWLEVCCCHYLCFSVFKSSLFSGFFYNFSNFWELILICLGMIFFKCFGLQVSWVSWICSMLVGNIAPYHILIPNVYYITFLGCHNKSPQND
jgi:hypothetical protein